MHLCLPLDAQSEEALADSTQVDCDWEKGQVRAAASLHVSLQKHADAWKPIRCQRFFYTGRYTSYFIVLSEKRVEDNDPQCRTANPGSIAASVSRDLATIEQNQEQQGNIASEETSKRDTAP